MQIRVFFAGPTALPGEGLGSFLNGTFQIGTVACVACQPKFWGFKENLGFDFQVSFAMDFSYITIFFRSDANHLGTSDHLSRNYLSGLNKSAPFGMIFWNPWKTCHDRIYL